MFFVLTYTLTKRSYSSVVMAGRLSGIAEKFVQTIQSLPISQTSRSGLLAGMIRVDHVGELAAVRICTGQLAVLKNTTAAPAISEMWKEEKSHLDEMERLVASYSVTPSLFSPLFALAGYTRYSFAGVTSAMGGKEAAMACTMAVEELIGGHYNEQIKKVIQVAPDEKKLLEILSKLRDDEMHHYEVARNNQGDKSSFLAPFTPVVQSGCKLAMKLAEKLKTEKYRRGPQEVFFILMNRYIW